jgi:N6-adenosine-specific RNA methylase IME4
MTRNSRTGSSEIAGKPRAAVAVIYRPTEPEIDPGVLAYLADRIATRRIDEIIVGERHRSALGDIASLARSIEQNDLIHPIVIRPDDVLVAGQRRLEAFKSLGRTEIPTRVVDMEEISRGEMAENTDRLNFPLSDIEAIRRTFEAAEKAKAKARMTLGKISPGSEAGRARDKIGAFAGVSGRTVEKIAAVVAAAAEADPERFGKLVEDMDRCGRVNGAHRRLVNMREAEQIRAEPPPLANGKWRVGVADVPWPSEPEDPEPAERGYWPFATMSIDPLCALPIGERLEEDAVLWFWTTNFHMRYSYPILDAWGFHATPTILTWDKGRPGRGQRLLGQTEHAIMAIRGKPVITLTNETTLLRAPAPKPLGRKPPEFYALVERLCPAAGYLDIFSHYRHGRRWTCWGAGAPVAPLAGALGAE